MSEEKPGGGAKGGGGSRSTLDTPPPPPRRKRGEGGGIPLPFLPYARQEKFFFSRDARIRETDAPRTHMRSIHPPPHAFDNTHRPPSSAGSQIRKIAIFASLRFVSSRISIIFVTTVLLLLLLLLFPMNSDRL